jgi:hypothetical protein
MHPVVFFIEGRSWPQCLSHIGLPLFNLHSDFGGSSSRKEAVFVFIEASFTAAVSYKVMAAFGYFL